MIRKRVEEYWHPERSQCEILRSGDRALASIALRNAHSTAGDEVEEFIEKRFPMVIEGELETPDEFFFTRDDAPMLVGALALLERTHLEGSLLKRIQRYQVRRLIGEIVAETPLRFVPAELYPDIATARTV
jgi:hypothetical protein